MLKKVVCLLAVAACLPFTASFSFAAAQTKGPAESVNMLREAVAANDFALAEKYADIDAIIKKGVERVIVDEKILREASKNPAVDMALALGPGAGNEVLRALLAAEAREYIRHGIVSGAFAGKPRPDVPAYGGLFPEAFRGGDNDRVTFGNATTTRITGDTAHVKTSLTRGRNARVYPLELVVRKREGIWRIEEVSNAAELFGGGKKGK